MVSMGEAALVMASQPTAITKRMAIPTKAVPHRSYSERSMPILEPTRRETQ